MKARTLLATVAAIAALTFVMDAITIPHSAWACGRSGGHPRGGGRSQYNYGPQGNLGPDIYDPPTESYSEPLPGATPDEYPVPPQASELIDQRNLLEDDVKFLQLMREKVFSGKMVLLRDAEGDFFPISVKAYVAARVENAFLDNKVSDNLDQVAGQIAAEVSTQQIAAQQQIDAMIQSTQQQIAGINGQLGYNRPQ